MLSQLEVLEEHFVEPRVAVLTSVDKDAVGIFIELRNKP